MTVAITPHLNFRGEAQAALEFYAEVFHGSLTLFTYAQFGAIQAPADADKIVWGQVTSEAGVRVMAYDVPTGLRYSPGEGAFFVSVRGDDADELLGYWAALTAGGQVLQELAPSSWSPLYGMITDRFRVTWILDIAPAVG